MLTSARSAASVRSGEQPWHPAMLAGRPYQHRPCREISEDQMEQKSKGAASDPKHINTEQSPEKGTALPTPKRGAFPTPKAIIENSPQYIPEGSEITCGESATEPVSSTDAEKKRHEGAK